MRWFDKNCVNDRDSVCVDGFSGGLCKTINHTTDRKKNDKKKTATLTGSRFSEKIDATGLNEYDKTIKSGDGENVIDVSGIGKNTIIAGKDNDTINIGETPNSSLTFLLE